MRATSRVKSKRHFFLRESRYIESHIPRIRWAQKAGEIGPSPELGAVNPHARMDSGIVDGYERGISSVAIL
mgnify:CR=1 FL=1|jgi:hypothetical protein